MDPKLFGRATYLLGAVSQRMVSFGTSNLCLPPGKVHLHLEIDALHSARKHRTSKSLLHPIPQDLFLCSCILSFFWRRAQGFEGYQ